MTFELSIDPADPVPIWKQIEDGVRRGIAAGELAPGSAVASVRELAVALRVNPATVAKAYRRLVDSGVLLVRRGEGTFVAELPAAEIEIMRRDELLRAGRRFAETARALGFGRNEAASLLDGIWEVETDD